MNKGRYKILLLVMVMVLTTFAAGFTDYDGNESFKYKTEGYGDSTWYFNEDGDKVDGPTDYWVKFFVSSDGMYLNYETNNMTISDLNVKGGDGYRVYSGSELGGSDFRAPDNDGGNIPQISHYSFLVGQITPVPMTYNVTVHKSITGETEISLAGFEFKLDGKTATTNRHGVAVFTGIEAGTYELKELLSDAQKEIFEMPSDKEVTVVDKDISIRFANTLKGVTPPMYNVTVYKSITGETGIPLDGFKFELDGKYAITNEAGIAVFTGIEAGTYTLKEILSIRQQGAFEMPSDKEVVVVDKDVPVRFGNTLKAVVPTTGVLTIQKAISTPTGAEVNDTTEFLFDVEKYNPTTKMWVAIEGSPFTIAGGENEVLTLPLGRYKVTERLNPDYILQGTNGRMLSLNVNDLTAFLQFVNKQKVVPTTGVLTIEKDIYTAAGVELDDDTEFLFDVERYNPRTETWVAIEGSPFTIAGGEDEVLVLPLGRYKVTERLDPDYTLRGINGRMLSLNVNDLEETLRFINIPVVPNTGVLTIQKAISTPTGAEVNDTTEFLFDVERYNSATKMWVAIEGSPFTIAGGENEVLTLPLGRYKVTERLNPDYILQGTNGRMLSLNVNDLTAFLQFVNEQRVAPTTGVLTIQKAISTPTGAEVNDTTEFLFDVERYNSATEKWEGILGSPFTIAGGENEVLTLPLGRYKVTERLHPDYILQGTNGRMLSLNRDNLTAFLQFVNEQRTVPIEDIGRITVSKIAQNRLGNEFTTNTRFYFELQMYDEDDGWVVVDEKSRIGSGTIVFDDLDDGEYRVVEVRLDSDFRLVSTNNIEVDIVDESHEEVEFINRLRPLVIQDDDDDEDRRPRRDTSDDDDDVTVVDSVTVIPSPVPQAPPVIVVVEQQPVPESVLEVEVVEERTPQATGALPRTGASDPTLFAGFGAALIAIGLYLNKKKI